MYVIYGKKACSFCTRAVSLLQSLGMDFTYYSMDQKIPDLLELATRYNHKTVPIVIKVEDSEYKFVGGYDALRQQLGIHDEK